MTSVLIIVSAADELALSDGGTHPTGFWPEELVVPMRAFAAAGIATTVATPGGRPARADEGGYLPATTGYDEAACGRLRAAVEELRPELDDPVALKSVDPADFDAVFVPGGHAPMTDLWADEDCGRIVRELHTAGRPVAAVCHGPAALLPAVDDTGRWVFDGYAMTCFTNAEEGDAGLDGRLVWTLEDRLGASGARFDAAPGWTENVVTDRNLHTGQNPASAGPLADRVVALLGAS